jgi:hypothetical protein
MLYPATKKKKSKKRKSTVFSVHLDQETFQMLERIRESHQPGFVSRLVRASIKETATLIDRRTLPQRVLLSQGDSNEEKKGLKE